MFWRDQAEIKTLEDRREAILAQGFAQSDSETIYKELLRIRYSIGELEGENLPDEEN